jgi:CheY-like chemotaxis protein
MALTILHVEDNKVVAEAVRDTLEAEGWRAVTCADGAAALSSLVSAARHDLLITDNHLPLVDGLEVVRHARRLEHHSDMPIVMFSGSDCEKAVYKAGVNVFTKEARRHRAINRECEGTDSAVARGGKGETRCRGTPTRVGRGGLCQGTRARR